MREPSSAIRWKLSTLDNPISSAVPEKSPGWPDLFEALADGRLLVVEDPNPGSQPRLDVTVHWTDEVRRKMKDAQ